MSSTPRMWGEKLLLIGGVRRVLYDTENRDGSDKFRMKAWTPTGGIVFKPTERTSVYFTYIEGLESAGTAPDGTAQPGFYHGAGGQQADRGRGFAQKCSAPWPASPISTLIAA